MNNFLFGFSAQRSITLVAVKLLSVFLGMLVCLSMPMLNVFALAKVKGFPFELSGLIPLENTMSLLILLVFEYSMTYVAVQMCAWPVPQRPLSNTGTCLHSTVSPLPRSAVQEIFAWRLQFSPFTNEVRSFWAVAALANRARMDKAFVLRLMLTIVVMLSVRGGERRKRD